MLRKKRDTYKLSKDLTSLISRYIFTTFQGSKSTCFSLKIGSRPAVGSSRIKSSGLWIKAAAKDTLLFWPPLISFIRRFSGGNWSNSERNFCLVSAKRQEQVIPTVSALIESNPTDFVVLETIDSAEVIERIAPCKLADEGDLLRHVTNSRSGDPGALAAGISTQNPHMSAVETLNPNDAG